MDFMLSVTKSYDTASSSKLASEKKSGFYVFVSAVFKVERYPENSMAHLKTVVGTGQKDFP